ncbi:hypothetical protein SDC9_91419 [bioreactor metagenome]|uniref:Uncharacterized protein n=1 Tax=bioreactor metagenome TaxID=1076179 RepID=A0A644ZWF2_9ZZZZ
MLSGEGHLSVCVAGSFRLDGTVLTISTENFMSPLSSTDASACLSSVTVPVDRATSRPSEPEALSTAEGISAGMITVSAFVPDTSIFNHTGLRTGCDFFDLRVSG